ncbi:hypothetical protein IB024_00155 [Brucella sp. 6810]|uniref:hypothetical protein n=1 Tax=Brucella sp. 6810 TaxID=2769351 RepID=UPI00165A75EB|nr:hypothetical protein [Brucella sp. 6810]QNQ62216.1 hypothetical protein IB024_00155 [Brucella sp. 6810]
MVEEEYLNEIDPEYLLGKIDMLQEIVAELIYQMPERAMKITEVHAKSHARDLEAEASETGNLGRKKYAAGAKEAEESITTNIDWIIDEIQDGGLIRTVQPAPIAKANWIDQKRKF